MNKFFRSFITLIPILAVFSVPKMALAETAAHIPAYSTASDLITAVNSLRATNGLAPYQANSILMGIAQAQAEYLASISVSNVHLDSQGRRPFQRALAAGYLVAGDLSLGGWFSENVTGGIGKTAEQAVEDWIGDQAHRDTMLSDVFLDAGAGVAVVDNTFYYCLDAGLSTGGTPVAYSSPVPLNPSTPSLIPNTPNTDGSIVHIVRPGDTLGSIYLAYNVPLADILSLNNLSTSSTIYTDQKIIIKAAHTPTPTQPTATPTLLPTSSPWPTSTIKATATDISPTSTPSPGLSSSTAGGAMAAIIVSTLALAGLIAFTGHKRKLH
jgi:uncharacterized protein YkwD